MGFQGLDAERVERLSCLVAECRPVLAGGTGMDAVQELLSSRQVSVMDSILVTRELLGAGPRALGEAKSIVLCSPSRSVERRQHQELVNSLVEGLDELVEES